MDKIAGESTYDAKPPFVSSSQEMRRRSQPSPLPELTLVLDDLVQGGEKIGGYDEDDEHKTDDSEARQQSQIRSELVDQDAMSMETQFQRNLKYQEAHYARQRQRFEILRKQSFLSTKSSKSSQSSNESDFDVQQRFSSSRNLTIAAKPTIGEQEEKGIQKDSLSRQSTHENHINRQCALDKNDWNKDEDKKHAQTLLCHIEGQACVEGHYKCIPKDESLISSQFPLNTPTVPFEEMHYRDTSNDAEHRHFELLHRLHSENDRFRQDLRSLREKNTTLGEQSMAREDEMSCLRKQLDNLEAQNQRCHERQMTAEQTKQKVKVMQKTIKAAQAEICDLQAALQESQDSKRQLQFECQLEITDLKLQVKQWKRTTKQLRQHKSSSEEIEWYKKTVASLEQEVIEKRLKVNVTKTEVAHLAATIEEKSAHCEAVEKSAADCVERSKISIKALQAASTFEFEKRKIAESVCSNLQLQMTRMQAENALLLEKQRDLEQHIVFFQEHAKTSKQTYQDELEKLANQLEEHADNHKSDIASMESLRNNYDSLKNCFEEAQAVENELKTQVTNESRIAQELAEALRYYVERAIDGLESCEALSLTEQEDLEQSSCPAQVPELLTVQVAISGLQTGTMKLVHELQCAQHVIRQQENKLLRAIERAAELEQLRAQDSRKRKELRKQCKIAEEAREIVLQEKLEIIKWSDQYSKRDEQVKAEVTKCKQLVYCMRKELHDTSMIKKLWDGTDLFCEESLMQSLSSLAKEINAIVIIDFHRKNEKLNQVNNVKESLTQIQLLKEELALKTEDFKRIIDQIESDHSNKAQEQLLYFEDRILSLTNEQTTLKTKFQQKSDILAEKETIIVKLQEDVDSFEEDLLVHESIFHLFILILQPLVLQVTDLQAQKRFLLRENAHFAQIYEQIECIGHVLKNVMPITAHTDDRVDKRPRCRIFQRVITAVLAINRFRTSSFNHQSPYGLSALFQKSSKKASAKTNQTTVIKILPPKQILSKTAYRLLLDRFKKMNLIEKMAEVIGEQSVLSGHLPVNFGSLVYSVVMTINPAAKELFVATDDRYSHRSKQSGQRGSLPMVALIRQGVLALGKRVEDLHYQQKSLEQEKYEYMSQLDQQTSNLKEMHDLLKKTEEVQHEMAALRSQTDNELQKVQEQHKVKGQEIHLKEANLVAAQAKIAKLHNKIADSQVRIKKVEVEKATLQRELEQLKSKSLEEEERAYTSTYVVRRLEDEVRNLKQAIKKTHELYKKASMQLELEVQEKATLQTMMTILRQKEEKANQKLRDKRPRKVAKEFYDCEREQESFIEHSGKTLSDVKAPIPTTLLKSQASSTSKIDKIACDTTLIKASLLQQNCKNCVPHGFHDDECERSSLPSRDCLSKFLSCEDVDRIMEAWQQLNCSESQRNSLLSQGQIACILSDATKLNKMSARDSVEILGNMSRNSLTIDNRRRDVETDKVNATVHDYMDQMDEKLSKVYGIPPSTMIQRSPQRLDVNTSREDRSEKREIN